MPVCGIAQPFITNEQSEKLFYDDYTDNTENWPLYNEADIKCYVVEGYYYMNRLSGDKSRAVVPSFKKIENKFMIKTSLALISSSASNQTVGVLFMAQADGSGGFVLELNKKQQFRVRGIVSAGQYITSGESGWVKSKNINGPDQFNKLVIKCYNGKYDIYINDQYTFSFENNAFKAGEMGLLAGPGSKSKVDYFYLYKITADIPDNLESLNNSVDGLKKENDSLKSVIENQLMRKIDSLEKVNAKLIEVNIFLKEAVTKRDTIVIHPEESATVPPTNEPVKEEKTPTPENKVILKETPAVKEE